MDSAQIQERAARSPFGASLGLQVKLLEVHEGGTRLVLRMPMRAHLCRSVESEQFHGGAIATFIDMAGVYAVAATAGTPPPTIHLSVDYLAAATGEWIEATATVRRQGRRVSTVDVDVVRPDGALVALGRASFMLG